MSIDIAISTIIRVLLVFVFLRAMLHKLGHYYHFTAQLESYRLLPTVILPAFALLLILIEGLLAFTLVIVRWPVPPVVAASVLTLYATAMSINLIKGRTDLDCGCDGPSASSQSISWALVIRNCVLAVLSLAAALPTTARAFSIQDIATVILAGSAVIFIYASIEQAIGNQQQSRRYFARNAKDSIGFFE